MPVNDLALGKSVKASSIKSSKCNDSNVADANWITRWMSVKGDLQWVYVDLQRIYSIYRINLRWYDKAYAACYRIQVSLDEDSWEDAYCTNSGDGGLDTIKLNIPVKAMYVRLCCMDNDNNREYSVIEFEVCGHLLKS